MLHGAYSYLLQDDDGQVSLTHSVSAGLDYALVGPEHAMLHKQGRAEYTSCTDEQALEAARLLARTEGIIPALESAHAVAEAARADGVEIAVADALVEPDARHLAGLAPMLTPLLIVTPLYIRAPDAIPQSGKSLPRTAP